MKIFNIDWETFLVFARRWRLLDAKHRRALLESKQTGMVATWGLDAEQLESAGFLDRYANSEDHRLGAAFKQSHRVLNALHKHPLSGGEAASLHRYTDEHLTVIHREGLCRELPYDTYRDRSALLRCVEISHPRAFSRTKDPAKWELSYAMNPVRAAVAPPLYLQDPQVGRDTQRLVKMLLKDTTPISIVEVTERLTRPGRDAMDERRLGAAIEASLRYLLVFAWLNSHDEPQLGIWPGIASSLHRKRTRQEVSLEAVSAEWFDTPFGISDIDAVLVRTAESLRVKADGRELYAKDREAVMDALLPAPWPLEFQEVSTFGLPREERRLIYGIEWALNLGLIRFAGTKGRGGPYALTDDAKNWLKKTPTERLQRVVDELRSDDENALTLALLMPNVSGTRLSTLNQSLLKSLADLASDKAISQIDFIEECAIQMAAKHPTRDGYGYPSYVPLMDQERDWAHAFLELMERVLTPFGIVATARTHQREEFVRATEVMDYLLGRTKTLELAGGDPTSGAPPIRVQPDFEIMFLAPSALAEAELAPFAERLEGRSGVAQKLGALFRLTAESVRQAGRAGLSLDDIEQALQRHSGMPLPDNVAHELRAWHASTIELKFEEVLILRCPDEESMARALSAGGSSLQPLGDNILLLKKTADRGKVQRACGKHGVFIEAPPKPPAKKKAQRKRRRYW